MSKGSSNDAESVLQQLAAAGVTVVIEETDQDGDWLHSREHAQEQLLAVLRSALEPTLVELRELQAWKESATAVLNGIELQSIGKQLGMPLGSDIGPNILPAIKRLQAENDKLRDVLRRSWETINDFFQDKTGETELNKMGDEVRQALSTP